MPNIEKETHFVMRNGKAEYPSVAQENLLVWYDAKGKHNPDRHKDTLLDLSGNNRHAELYNFAYEKKSGYLDNPEGGLLFDDVDDKLVYPSVKDEVEYTSASRNLFDKSYVVMGKYHSSPGTLVNELTSSASTQFIRVKQGVPYIWGSADKYKIIIMTFDSNKNPIERIVAYTVLTRSFSEDVAYVQVSSYQKHYDFNDFQFEEGSTATPYTPYVPLPVITYQYNGNILSYEADGTVKRVDDGKVITRKGINLVRNGNAYKGTSGFGQHQAINLRSSDYGVSATGDGTSSSASIVSTSFAIKGDQLYKAEDVFYMSGEVAIWSAGDAEEIGDVQIQFRTNRGLIIGSRISFPELGTWHKMSGLFEIGEQDLGYSNPYMRIQTYQYKNPSNKNVELSVNNFQLINLTEAYGAGNEPTLEYIQAHPEEFAWTPNPNDLIEAHEIKNNLVGDLEDLHGTGDKTEILSGVGEVFTDQADDDSIVHVELEGRSVQPHRFREESGDSLVLTNHGEDKPRKLEVLGNTFQNAGSGKNLFNFNSITRTVNSSLLITEVESNGFTVESTNTTRWQTIVWELDSVLKPDKTYTIKFPFRLLSGNITDSYAQVSLDRELIGSLVKRTDSLTGTFKTNGLIKGTSKLTINLHINGISDVVLKKVQFYNIQLEEGSVATAYEPPAPSPDYPIEMKSVGDGLELVSGIGGRNLLNTSMLGGASKDRSVTAFTLSSWASAALRKEWVSDKLKPNTHYTMSYKVRMLKKTTTYNSDVRLGRFLLFGGGTAIQMGSLTKEQYEVMNDNDVQSVTGTFKTPADLTGSSVLVYTALVDGVTASMRFEDIKIEEGSTATPYTPAPEDVPLNTTQNGVFRTKPNLTVPLRKVGDVADRLFWDSTAGKWKVERRVGEVEIATKGHSWTWLKGVSSNPDYYYFYRTQDSLGMTGGRRRIYSGTSPLKSNRLRVLSPRPYVSVSEEAIVPWPDLTPFIFVLHKTRLGELTDANINAWFEANPTTILYELETPVIETLEGGKLPPLFFPTSYLDTISEVKGQLTAGYRLKEGVTPESSDILVAPEYVNPIHSVNDFDVVSSVGKRNSFSITGLPWNSTNLILEEDGTFTSQGNNSSFAIFSMHKLNVPVGKTYTASFEVMVLDNAIQFTNNNVYINGASPSSTHNRPTLTKDEWVKVYTTFNYTIENTRTVHIYFNQGLNLPIGKVKFRYFKVEEGFTPTDWTPAPEDIQPDTFTPSLYKTNILLSEPLRSVGDVKDRLFRDSDGLWKVERNIGRYVVTGNEKWSDQYVSSTGLILSAGALNGIEGQHPIISTHTSEVSITNNYGGGLGFKYAYDVFNVNSIEEFSNLLKQHYNENPIVVYYALKNRTIETLPQADQDKLNNIATYAGNNYVYTLVDKTNILPSYVRDNLKPNLNAKFRKLSWFWSRLLFNQLKIWKRNLTDSELLHEWKQNKKRWGM